MPPGFGNSHLPVLLRSGQCCIFDIGFRRSRSDRDSMFASVGRRATAGDLAGASRSYDDLKNVKTPFYAGFPWTSSVLSHCGFTNRYKVNTNPHKPIQGETNRSPILTDLTHLAHLTDLTAMS